MPEGKENKRHSKVPAGIAATSNRLETTKAVLNTLKGVETSTLGELSFLREASRTALAILAIVQGIEDGDIDDDFVALALDSLGLVYIVIDQCEEESKANGTVFDEMKVNSGELARTLQGVAGFVEKKAHRNRLKQIIKRSADEEKVDNYRQQLKTWMNKFGKFGDFSIHDVLQEVIDDKLRRLEQRDKKPKELIAETFLEAGRPLTPLRYPPPPVIITPSSSPPPVPPKPPKEKPLKPISSTNVLPTRDKSPSRTETPDPQPQPPKQHSSPSSSSTASREEKERQRVESEERRKKRHEEEKARRLAERERFRKSEQDFNQLPDANPAKETRPKAASYSGTHPPIITVDNRPAEATSKHPSTHTRSRSQIEEDERLAAALHADIQKEFANTDEQIALSLAMSEKGGWEANRQGRSGRSGGRGDHKPRPRSRSRHKAPSLELRYGDTVPEGSLEDAKPEGYYTPAPVKYPPGESKASRSSGRRRSSPKPPDDAIPSAYYTPQQSPYPVYAPSPVPPAMSNIAYSAISVGGGAVVVENRDTGNFRSVRVADSLNDYSINHYAEDESD